MDMEPRIEVCGQGTARTRALRTQLNRLITAVVLLLALPHVAVMRPLGPRRARGAARFWVRMAARLTGVHFETWGHLEARPGVAQVLVANHSSLLDAVAILAVQPKARFVAGADLFKIPLLGSALRALQTIPVDRRSANRSLLVIPESDRAGEWVLAVFPQGAIGSAGERMRFRRGAFAMAIQQHADIVPVAIHHSERILPPRARLAVKPGVVAVEFLSAMRTKDLILDDRHGLCDRAEQAVFSALRAEEAGCCVGAGFEPKELQELGR
jgi:1-acyl-sn-glycerol-3-phosphate acyltransferase